ncbi:hypothetical protein [Acetobacterium malicum]|uniref:hypothetical protein n=1 Tax=Acetobacterium malicum TaxID=52692 RepID=UPI000403D872|nr:hypothetical protein [Acetobacterium dehalogenans]
MDLVTDYKAITNENTNNTVTYLRKIYSADNFDEEFIYNINKYYTALSTWFSYINCDEEALNKLLDNILFNYCSLIHCIVFKDNKIIHFLIRNTIESFFRFCNKDIVSKQVDILFENANKLLPIGDNKNMLMNFTSQMKQIYNENCLYIHAAPEKMKLDLNNLLDYQSNQNQDKNNEYLNAKKDFIKVNNAMLCTLLLIYNQDFKRMKLNAQGYIEEAMNFSDRLKIRNL